ncbi:MAG: ABC transporter permease subunit [Cellulosilyticaceae bacterium]
MIKHSMSIMGIRLNTKTYFKEYKKSFKRNYDLYLLLIPVIIFYLIFHYGPMYGVQIAFKDFLAVEGIMGSPWVGFKHFDKFFNSYYFFRLIYNTISISFLQLIFSFPAPIILALMINELGVGKFKKAIQNITYAPHFLSTVVIVGMLTNFLSPNTGFINNILEFFGQEPIAFLTEPSWFKAIYVTSGVWQNAGWSSIIYIAALSGIDPEIHEAAKIDGAGKLQRIRHINLPGIVPTMVILLILNVGGIMNVGFEKIFLMQNDLNLEVSDVITTYSYKMGIQGAQYSFSAAIGLFNSVINFILLIVVNKFAKKLTENSLW